MEWKKDFNIDWIVIDIKTHVRDIFSVHESLLYDTVMSINEYDHESGALKLYERADLYPT